jgi:hypothetical protein
MHDTVGNAPRSAAAGRYCKRDCDRTRIGAMSHTSWMTRIGLLALMSVATIATAPNNLALVKGAPYARCK